MSDHTPGISAIGQLAISVSDVDRAAAFYQDVLGLRLLFRFPGMAFFDCGGVRLYLTRPEKPEFARTSIVYYRVPDIQAGFEALTARGVTVVDPPRVVHKTDASELWLAFIRDTEDNTLALMSEVPVTPTGSEPVGQRS